tara:strand:- start:47804 stop:47965 length:162 start_codon:yes stop_codon:yes gene_type:complete
MAPPSGEIEKPNHAFLLCFHADFYFPVQSFTTVPFAAVCAKLRPFVQIASVCA